MREWNLQNSYFSLPSDFYQSATPSEFPKPEMVLWNEELAEKLSLEKEEDMEQIFVGNRFPEGSRPISLAYTGHQFGYFTMLGDGRAILLGEIISKEGERFDIQLKGSGRTAYSRNGDGKARLSPMLREYLISEAMYHLGIATTRSLAVAMTGEKIFRDQAYEGAVLTRVASSHLRVGTFQFAFIRGKEELQKLADYTIQRHYPEWSGQTYRYEKLLEAVVEKQASLIARWQLIGFIHGVMNTDNMTISGETIDYGPCAFMDEYSPATVFSSIDTGGRYRYERQPEMAFWNLSRLADSLLPLISELQEEAIATAGAYVEKFREIYRREWLSGMRKKLGLTAELVLDGTLCEELLHQMEICKADYTNTFVRLTLEAMGEDGSYLEGTQELYASDDFQEWLFVWKDRRGLKEENPEQGLQQMQASNPFVIPRNHRVEEVLKKAEEGDLQSYLHFLELLKKPYHYTQENREYQELPKQSMQGYRTFCGT